MSLTTYLNRCSNGIPLNRKLNGSSLIFVTDSYLSHLCIILIFLSGRYPTEFFSSRHSNWYEHAHCLNNGTSTSAHRLHSIDYQGLLVPTSLLEQPSSVAAFYLHNNLKMSGDHRNPDYQVALCQRCLYTSVTHQLFIDKCRGWLVIIGYAIMDRSK